MTVKKKICVVTGTRAEYGLLRHLMQLINDSDVFELQTVATGMHLSKKFGETYKDIEEDGFVINRKVDLMLASDTSVGISKSTSLGLIGLADAYEVLKPNLVLVLGDRFEILSAVIAAMFARLPIAHIHGGERTEGLVDEAIRHSITKFSHLHFVATGEYRKRVIQLGEMPNKVFNVGGMGVDAIKKIELLKKDRLEDALGIKFKKKNLLITFHPITLEKQTSFRQMQELLNALVELKDTLHIFTMPNADMEGHVIYETIQSFVDKNENCHVFKSLGQLLYLSCINQVDAVIGNSSSGLTEVPTFKKATINIGDRQKGRAMAESVINCSPSTIDIKNSINKAYDIDFQKKLLNCKNPYGEGGSSEKIFNILKSTSFENLIKKEFYDMDPK